MLQRQLESRAAAEQGVRRHTAGGHECGDERALVGGRCHVSVREAGFRKACARQAADQLDLVGEARNL